MKAAFVIFLLASNFLLFILFLHFYNLTTRIINNPELDNCGRYVWPAIQFPFKLRDRGYGSRSERCGCNKGTGFELFCGGETKNQTLITFPDSGDFVVKRISYTDRKLWINDPHNCLPKRHTYRFLKDIGSPFQISYGSRLIILYECTNKHIYEAYSWVPVPCMSGGNTTVFAVPSVHGGNRDFFGCKEISYALVPMVSNNVDCDYCIAQEQLFADIELQWTRPSCTYQHCEEYRMIKYTLGLGLATAGILGLAKVYGARRAR